MPKRKLGDFAREKAGKALRTVAARIYRKRARFWGTPKPIALKDLLVGDIVLCKAPQTLKNALGGLLTGTPFSHAAIFIGPKGFVDMRPGGFKVVSPDAGMRLYQRSSGFFFRPVLTERQRENVVLHSVAWVTIPFNKRIAQIIRFSEVSGIKIRNPKIKGYACTSIVADIFAKSGANLVSGVSPLRAGPLHLLKSKKLSPLN